jgi:hypothetical protein
MSAGVGFLTPEAARASVGAELDVIDAALARLRATSTDLVGNAFRVQVARRLETQHRTVRGLSYRVFGEIENPPDGEDTAVPAGIKVRDLLARGLRITPTEVRRRFRLAARIRARRSLIGQPLPAELPALAAAVADGALDDEHVKAICTALDVLPTAVSAAEKTRAETVLVGHARAQDAPFVAAVGRKIAEALNPDGFFDDRDRALRRGATLGKQGVDGTSKLTVTLTPEGRAYVETLGAAVRPGHHLPGHDGTVVDAATDTRTPSQRLHDAIVWGWRAGIASGELGSHRGIPVTVIATTTVADLEQAAAAMADPNQPMPAPARTGGGSTLPMRDLIAMAARSVHYLAVFEDHSNRPIYLGRSTRIATVDQRMICHARDKGCTRPGCTEPGYHCEVMHTPDWHPDGRTDADTLHFGCGPDHKLITNGHATTTVTDDGHLAWTDGTGPPQTNPIHHADTDFLKADNSLEDGGKGTPDDG